MLYALKGNKQLKIDDAEKDSYLKLGYDIAKEEDGNLQVVETSPAKVVAYTKYKEEQDKVAVLEKQVAELTDLAEKGKAAAELEKKAPEGSK